MVHASPISDHDLIGIIRKINCKKFSPRKIQCRNYKNFNPDRFKQDLRNQPWTDILNINNLNTAWNEFKNLLTAVIEKHAPLQERIVRGNDSPWLTSEIKKKIRDRDYYLRKARKTNSENDWSNYRRCRNMVTTAIRISKARYNRDLLRENSNNPKNFWKTIKRRYPTKSNGANPNKLFNINGEKISDIKSISEGFCTYFSTVAKTLQQRVVSVIDRVWRDRFDLDLKRRVNPNNNVFKFRQIQPHEVLYSLRKLKISKSAGVDNLPPMLIKQGAEEIAHPLNVLINRSIQESIFPTAEKCAKVIPIYKSGERAVFDNYRPISVLPILSKIIERLVYQQLYEYLENHSLLSQNQFGFRGGRCTAHAVLHLTECIRENMDKGNLTGAVYIDLKKAFDTVDHGCLLSKMSYYGIENNELKWFEDYMFNRMQYVQYDGINSERQNITCGVPQGSILGPLLFIIHINDINIVLQKANLILYADDTVMFYSGKNTQEIQYVLHNELEKLAIWFKQNNLTVNMKIGKTEFVLYGTMKRISQQTPDHQIDLKINGETINESKSYEYLGVTMDSNLSFTKYLHKLYKKGITRVKLLSTVRINISPYVAETIYKTMVEPVIMYCSTVFLGDQRQCCKKLQNIQDRAHKIVFGNKIKNSWIPLQNQRELNGAIDVFKSIHGLCPDVFKNTFTKINHQKATRGNGINLLVPRSKTETGRKMFANQGALLFNKLPGDLKEERSLLLFKSKMRLKHCDF